MFSRNVGGWSDNGNSSNWLQRFGNAISDQVAAMIMEDLFRHEMPLTNPLEMYLL